KTKQMTLRQNGRKMREEKKNSSCALKKKIARGSLIAKQTQNEMQEKTKNLVKTSGMMRKRQSYKNSFTLTKQNSKLLTKSQESTWRVIELVDTQRLSLRAYHRNLLHSLTLECQL